VNGGKDHGESSAGRARGLKEDERGLKEKKKKQNRGMSSVPRVDSRGFRSQRKTEWRGDVETTDPSCRKSP